MTLKNMMKKNIFFHEENMNKNGQNWTKIGHCEYLYLRLTLHNVGYCYANVVEALLGKKISAIY